MGEIKINKCNNFFKSEDIEERRKELCELIIELINFKIKENKET